MRSFTSNSKAHATITPSSRADDTAYRRLPAVGLKSLLAALIVFFAFVATMEFRLQLHGIHTTAVDGPALWVRERERASHLGERALILVGASRVQTGIDLDVVRAQTRLEPVQLAIDGSSFLPVFAGLARDPSIRGTIVVSFQDSALVAPEGKGIADEYEALYETRVDAENGFEYSSVENRLNDGIHNHLRSYADGARPLSSLLTRIIPAKPTPQYAIVLPDRSRLADYATVDVPTVYYSRVIRELGERIEFPAGTEFSLIDAQIRAKISALPSESEVLYMQRANAIADEARTIESRGGHVIFFVLPTSGLITSLEEKRFPRATFWDRFAATTNSRAVHFKDVPSLREFRVPDGSHIDYHDRPALTMALLSSLQTTKSSRD